MVISFVSWKYDLWASYQIRKIAGCACAGNAGYVFPHRLQRKPIVNDPHIPWCMLGSLTRGGEENVPGIPCACATRNFVYMVRGPLSNPAITVLYVILFYNWPWFNWPWTADIKCVGVFINMIPGNGFLLYGTRPSHWPILIINRTLRNKV